MENRTKTQQEIEQEMLELNDQFAAFLHTKGMKAKYKLVVENIKKGARESKEKTKEQIAKAKELGKVKKPVTYSASDLSKEFNEFFY